MDRTYIASENSAEHRDVAGTKEAIEKELVEIL